MARKLADLLPDVKMPGSPEWDKAMKEVEGAMGALIMAAERFENITGFKLRLTVSFKELKIGKRVKE